MSYKQEWYVKNREKAIEYTKQWQKENPEKCAIRNKRDTDKNKELIASKVKIYKAKNKEKVREWARKWNLTVKNRRKEAVLALKNSMGGKCSRCPYKEEVRILHFHHLRDKKFNIGAYKRYSLDALIEEAKKCILLCPNCHALEHLHV